MKRQLVSILVLMSFIVGLTLAQSTIRGKRKAQKPKFDEKLGTCNITGFSKYQVWGAVLNALKLKQIEFVKSTENLIMARVATRDKAEVDIMVVDHPGPSDSLRPWAPAVSLGIDIPIIGELGDNRTWTTAHRRALSRELYEKITDILYAIPTK